MEMEGFYTKVKAVVVMATTALVSWLGALALPLGLLVLCNVIDYATGIVAAPKRGHRRSSDKGIAGIMKKICQWLLVGVGMIMDAMLHYLVDVVGWKIPFSFMVATLVCVWLLANELLSIIENISDITGNVPPFLKPIINWVKHQVEEKGRAVEDSIETTGGEKDG
jgi:toxin secretion/phage lysis holin